MCGDLLVSKVNAFWEKLWSSFFRIRIVIHLTQKHQVCKSNFLNALLVTQSATLCIKQAYMYIKNMERIFANLHKIYVTMTKAMEGCFKVAHDIYRHCRT